MIDHRLPGSRRVMVAHRLVDQAVVDGGNVPLDVLAGNVSRYIAGA